MEEDTTTPLTGTSHVVLNKPLHIVEPKTSTSPKHIDCVKESVSRSRLERQALQILRDLGFKDIPSPDLHGGRLTQFEQNWRLITQDPWILQVVKGKPIDWLEIPKQNKEPPELNFSPEERSQVQEEVTKMLSLGVIETCEEDPDQVVSSIFLRDKKGGGKT